jgi:sugar lactone lactonase YvrE
MKGKELGFMFIAGFVLITASSCYRMRGSNGGGEIDAIPSRKINASDVALHPGYKIETVASNLTFPTGVAFDDQDNMYVVEAGYSYGEVWGEPKLLKIDKAGNTTIVAKGPKNGPWTGVVWHDGAFYIAEGGEMEGGKILRVTTDGKITSLVANLPSVGDHHTNGPVIKDGYIYFGQGVATNSAVVGKDNADFGWLLRRKDFHDIPCADITLTGENYKSPNVLTDDPNDETSTGAFVPFGQATTPGQVIKGKIPCTGSILRIPLAGGNPELVAWGFRNPFGLSFNSDGKLYVTDNGLDERGSRPVWGAADAVWEIKNGLWYGWPDFSAGKAVFNDEEFKTPGKDKVKPVLKNYPNTPPKPAAILGVHSSSNGIDFSRTGNFGFPGEAFIAQFGDMAPGAGKTLFPVGFKIVRVNVSTGVVRDFATNKGKRNGPASWLGRGGLERPVSVKFNHAENALYVVDFGIMKTTKEGPLPQTNTGMIWKITKK